MKKNLSLVALLLVFTLSCNKSNVKETTSSKLNFKELTTSLGTLAQKQIESSRTLLQLTKTQLTKKTVINEYGLKSDDYSKTVYLDFGPLHEYYEQFFDTDLSPKATSTSSVKINVVNPNPGPPVGVVGITGDSYPEHATDSFNINTAVNTPNTNSTVVSETLPYMSDYIAITRSYTSLSSYTSRLNTLETTVYNSQISNDQKTSVIYQIEFLKAYAADLENNLGYYEGLMNGTNPVAVSSVNDNKTVNSANPVVYKLANCKVNVGDVLMGGIVAGFWTGAAGAINGAAGGTIALPGGGTVTGGVGGFVVGFTYGFVTSVVQGTVSSLLRTCGK